jgi:hypothetical protein
MCDRLPATTCRRRAASFACRAGATTNSDSGVTDFRKVLPALRAMAELGVLLLVHGEVTDPEVDMFDREAVFIAQKLVGSRGCLTVRCSSNSSSSGSSVGGNAGSTDVQWAVCFHPLLVAACTHAMLAAVTRLMHVLPCVPARWQVAPLRCEAAAGCHSAVMPAPPVASARWSGVTACLVASTANVDWPSSVPAQFQSCQAPPLLQGALLAVLPSIAACTVRAVRPARHVKQVPAAVPRSARCVRTALAVLRGLPQPAPSACVGLP